MRKDVAVPIQRMILPFVPVLLYSCMSSSTIQPTNITTDIHGIATKGMLFCGMRAVIIENDDKDILRYFVKAGTEIDEGTVVKKGDVLGKPGRFPEMLMIGAVKYSFPKKFQLNSGGLIKLEANLYGSDGKYYIARICAVAILQEDETFEIELGLDSEIVEQLFYAADETIIDGKTVSNVTSLYGIREEEIREDEKDWPLSSWLESKSSIGKIFFWCPYEQLLWLEGDLNNLTDVLFKRIFHQS